ncbi:MAG: alpha-N-arabinofuranosidase [Lentisphaeria bacterium]|nr:alpha-N-arabinofuranosidase [Lentisphaeria bacterium]
MNGKIYINRNFTVGKAEDTLYGGFIEHIGRAVYSGIYEPSHPTADKDGFRQDVIELVRELDMPVTRYPGGNFVSGFDWKDAIGPQNERPARPDCAWKSIEPNSVGIDEFMKWCKKANTTPIYAVNLGTGTPKSAQEIVEYCNLPGGTYWSDKRKQNGSATPHNIKYWCLGNEMDGDWQIGHKTPQEYGRIAHETAKMMKIIDGSIKLCACGSSSGTLPSFALWDEQIMQYLYDDVDYLSIHRYFGNGDKNIAKFLASPEELDRRIEDVIACCDAVKAQKKSSKTIMISLDEWNVWYRTNGKTDETHAWKTAPPILEENYDMADVLVVGGSLLSMLDHADRLKMACIAQTVNVIAPIMTEKGGKAWKQSIYYPFLETSRHGRGMVMRSVVDSPAYTPAPGREPVKYLRAVAVWNQEKNEIAIFAINRAAETMDFSAELGDFSTPSLIEAKEIHHPDLDAKNSADAQNITSKSIDLHLAELKDNQLSAQLKPYSWNMFLLKLQNPAR